VSPSSMSLGIPLTGLPRPAQSTMPSQWQPSIWPDGALNSCRPSAMLHLCRQQLNQLQWLRQHEMYQSVASQPLSLQHVSHCQAEPVNTTLPSCLSGAAVLPWSELSSTR
jgi:hypothetical protein